MYEWGDEQRDGKRETQKKKEIRRTKSKMNEFVIGSRGGSTSFE